MIFVNNIHSKRRLSFVTALTFVLGACGSGSNDTVTGSDSTPVLEELLAPIEPNPGRDDSDLLNDSSSESPELSSQQIAALPADCLLSLDLGLNAYCVSPQSRQLLVVNHSGDLLWVKSIPGENSTDPVEGLSVVGQTALLLIAADAEPGLRHHDIYSYSKSSIVRIATVDPFKRIRGNRAIGSARLNYLENELLTVSTGHSLFVAFPWHELLPGGDPGQLTDWIPGGTLLTQVNLSAGNTVSYRMLSAQSIAAIEIVDGDTVVITLAGTDGNESSLKIAADSLDILPLHTEDQIVNTVSVATLVPDLFRTLQGDFLRSMGNDLAVLDQALDFDPMEIKWPCTLYSDENPAECLFNQEIGPQTLYCEKGGTATRTIVASASYIEGASSNRVDLTLTSFNECALTVVGNDTLSGGIYKVNGNYSVENKVGGVVSGRFSQIKTSFKDLSLDYPNSGKAFVNGSETTRFYNDQSRKRNWEISVNSYVDEDMEISDYFYQHEEISQLPDHGLKHSLTLSGGMKINSAQTGNKTLTYSIAPAIRGDYSSVDPVVEGQVLIEAADQSRVSLQFRVATDNVDMELADLVIENSHGTQKATLPLSALFNRIWW